MTHRGTHIEQVKNEIVLMKCERIEKEFKESLQLGVAEGSGILFF